MRLLLSDEDREAEEIAAVLEEENRARQDVDGQTLREAMSLLERSYDPDGGRGMVVTNTPDVLTDAAADKAGQLSRRHRARRCSRRGTSRRVLGGRAPITPVHPQ